MNYVDIKLGYDCNNHCKHCIIVGQRTEARRLTGKENRDTQECIAEIEDSFKMGHKKMVITGGEPTIRDDFLFLAKYAYNLGFETSLQTNGRKLSNIEFAIDVSHYIKNFIIALHGSKDEIHDKITGVPNSFQETIAGIQNLKKLDVSIVAKIVISKDNATDLVNIMTLLNKLNVNEVNIAFPHACEEMLKEYDVIVPTYSEIRNTIQSCIDFAIETKMNLEFETILPCSLDGKYPVKYFADFKYFNDCSSVKQIGNESILWNEARKSIKRKFEGCINCIYNSKCEGYWMEYIILRGTEEFVPITN